MKKNNRKVEIISFVVLIILIMCLGLTVYLRRNQITNVNKVLSNKYDEIKCIDKNCDYITVYSKAKNKIYVYDSYGTKISKYNKSNSRMIYGATSSYLLFKEVGKDGEIKGYYITKTSGKKVYSSKNELSVLSDFLVEEDLDDSKNIINYRGKVIYSEVKSIKRYQDVTSIKVMNDEYLINESGDRILSDYTVEKEVRDEEKDKTLYLILKDSSNAFYYFDVKDSKLKGEEFTSYELNEKNYSLKVTKKSNGETIKLVVSKNGDQKDDENETQVKLVNKVKPDLDEKYSMYEKSMFSSRQTKVLVDNKEDNSFGTFDFKEKKYKKIYSYTKDNGTSLLLSLKSYNDKKYLQITCSAEMCGNDKVTIYDVEKGKVLFEYNHGENEIQYFSGFDGGYKLVKYSTNAEEAYRDKYVLYDKNNKKIASSTNMIIVLGKELLFGKKYTEEPAILFSAKTKKVINNDDALATKEKVGYVNLFTYSDEKYTYLVSDIGKQLFKITNENSNLIYSDRVILNINDKKVKIIDAKNNKVGEYIFEENESLLNEEGKTILTYKNSIFVNNSEDNYGKIVDYSGSKIKKLKNTTIHEVHYGKKSKNVIIITTNNKKYGFYIAK